MSTLLVVNCYSANDVGCLVHIQVAMTKLTFKREKKQYDYTGTTFEFIWSQHSINSIKSSSSMLITMNKNTFTTAMTMIHYLESIFLYFHGVVDWNGRENHTYSHTDHATSLSVFQMYVMILVMRASKNCKPIMLVQTLFIDHGCPNILVNSHFSIVTSLVSLKCLIE